MTDTTAQIPQPDVDKALPVRPKLYSPGQITAGALVGSFLAAGLLARVNLLAQGKEKRANAVLAASIAFTLALMAVAMFVPLIPSPVFLVVQVGTVLTLARQEFGAVTALEKRSSWGVLGWGVAAFAIVVALLVAIAFVAPAGTLPE